MRVWYRWYDMYAHLTERIDVVVVCLVKRVVGLQHPEQSLQANSVRTVFSPEMHDELSVQGEWLESSRSYTGH